MFIYVHRIKNIDHCGHQMTIINKGNSYKQATDCGSRNKKIKNKGYILDCNNKGNFRKNVKVKKNFIDNLKVGGEMNRKIEIESGILKGIFKFQLVKVGDKKILAFVGQ